MTQATSKITPVTMYEPSGKIIMNNESLSAGASVSFEVFNSLITDNSVVIVNAADYFASGSSPSSYEVSAFVTSPGAVSFYIRLKNVTGSNKIDALRLNFSVLNTATS